MNLNSFMNKGIQNIVGTMGRYYVTNRKGRGLLSSMLLRIQKCADIRRDHENAGTHIPPFLIASVASQCNLHCAGCYARAGGACGEVRSANDLSGEKWESLFEEAAGLGIPFILLAGGEPFMRRDVIQAAARNKDIVFPVFTNGTMLDAENLTLLDESRNIIPVFSIEGEAQQTDRRRGEGVSSVLEGAMDHLKEKGVLFGVSITVTSENLHEVADPRFLAGLRNKGCGLVFFVEYVPVSEGTEYLALDEEEIGVLAGITAKLKQRFRDMILLSFPGDEAAMGGCLASGRGFFHINASGGAEPCPFSPYSRLNVKSSSILQILQSDYFVSMRGIAQNAGEHSGGCTLFAMQDQVAALHAL